MERRTYVLVDGENIDATLGQSILGRRPHPHERPRWDRVLSFVASEWDQPTQGLFFIAANGEVPMSFVQALTAMDFRPVLLSGTPDQKVVDIAIQRTLEALAEREDDVVLAQLGALVGTRRTALLAFREMRSSAFVPLVERGLEFYDLEYDVRAFNEELPRIRVVPIEEFDPLQFL